MADSAVAQRREPESPATAPGRGFDALSRETLASGVARVLHRGGWGNPDVLLVRSGKDQVVVKDFLPRGPLVRRTLGRWLTKREVRAYRRLAKVEAVPKLLGELDELAFVIEYRPGELLSRSLGPSLPPSFLPELARCITDMHGCGVVHLDLRHRSNILADPRGRPVLLDFASAICFSPRGALARWGVSVLGRIDRHALRKWQRKLAQSELGSAASATGTGSAGSRADRRPM